MAARGIMNLGVGDGVSSGVANNSNHSTNISHHTSNVATNNPKESRMQHVRYRYLPHTAIVNSHVSLSVKSFHCCMDEISTNGCFWPPCKPRNNHSSLHRSSSIATKEEEMLYVEARLYALGVPLHQTPVSTCRGSLSTKMTSTLSCCTHACYFPSSVLVFPCKWNEVPKDTCIQLQVKDSNENVVYQTSLSLFYSPSTGNDDGIVLRMGLQKLHLTPLNQATSNTTTNNSSSWLSTGSLYHFGQHQSPPANNHDTDPKWKANVVLDILDRMETKQSLVPQTNTPTSTNTNIEPVHHSIPSVPWLDILTRQKCQDVLQEIPDDTCIPLNNSIENKTMPATLLQPKTQKSSYLPAFYAAMFQNHKNTNGNILDYQQAAASLCYLIVELPMCDIPVLFEETLYPTISSSLAATAATTTEDVRINPDVAAKSKKTALVIFDDYEQEDDNPAEEKYRTLAHDLIRGVVDPALKPDREQRAKLDQIIGSPSQHLTTDEKDLLWRFRFTLVDNRKALTKFLLAVEWTVESEVVQAAELLEQWRKRSPIEVTDALKLLGKNVAFQTSLVRAYAIDTLAAAPDDELRLYLLQLVQALKYENAMMDNPNNTSTKQLHQKKNTSLATFLIDRASQNIELASYLYWYLTVELEEPQNEVRYSAIFTAFQEKLSKATFDDSNKSMWEILKAQDSFISKIMDCQMKGRDAKGRKDAKETHLRELLATIQHSDDPVPLPSAPHKWVLGLKPDTAKMFKSALYPSVIEFILHKSNKCDNNTDTDSTDRTTSSDEEDGKQKSNLNTYKVIVKTGDDLRQDQLVIMMIQLMDKLLKRGTLNLCLKPYSIIAMSPSTGLVEFVGGSIPISQILGTFNYSILQFFQRVAPQEGAKYNIQPGVLQTYIKSCAGYCVITYLLGVGDRHLDNIMLLPSGHFFHIDFGFIFGRDPKPLPPAFRLTREMVDGMGGTDSPEYRQFCSLACQAFNILRKSAGLVLNLLRLMSDAGIDDLSNNPSADTDGVIAKVEERFRLELTDEQAEHYFNGLINDCLSALAPRVMDMFHQMAVARR